MTEISSLTRPGGRSARVRGAVHRAVEELLAEGPPETLTMPLVAARADNVRVASSVSNFFATITSRQAAHSNADPRAKSRNRQRSLIANFAFPSAIFSGTLVEARLS